MNGWARGTTRATKLWQFSWLWLPGTEAADDDALIGQCVDLYSREYGVWGERGKDPGARIRMSRARIRGLLARDEAWLACAYSDSQLVGYCAAVFLHLPERGRVAWVTQLVVDSSFREARVATNLLFGVWEFSDCYAWGLATPNPFAVRALETATRRPVRASMVREYGAEVLESLARHITYIPAALCVDDTGRAVPKVDTEFFVDLGDLPKMREDAARADRPWDLGTINDGEEWLACTFSVQSPAAIDDDRLRALLEGADEIWISAYEAMSLDKHHRWHEFTPQEVESILVATKIPDGGSVLDVGCGDARHAIELARRGFSVTAVEIAPRLLERARQVESVDGVSLAIYDARASLPEGDFDLVLLLYDVLGSSASVNDDLAILRNVRRAVATHGHVVVSVMNTLVTASRVPDEQRPTSVADFARALETLRPSSTMEETGNIFDPTLLVYFNGLYYRKEQFDAAIWHLPAELVVRDKRYDAQELRELFDDAGLAVLEIRPVQLGAWMEQPPLAETDQAAKEYLVIARPRA